jgi:hypothetical protein
MAKKERPIVITLNGLSDKEQRKVSDRLVKKVLKDKKFRRTMDTAGKKLSKKAAETAARVAVSEALGVEQDPTVQADRGVSLGTSGLEIYADLVSRFAKARRRKKKNEKKVAKKQAKKLKKKGGKLSKKTGLIKLMKAEKLKRVSKLKPRRVKYKKLKLSKK